MKHTILIFGFVFLSAIGLLAQLPVISGVTFTPNTANPSTATITWTTDVGSDALVVWGNSFQTWYAPVTAAGVFPDPAAVHDTTCCVTSHSATLTGLVPGQEVAVAVRSRGFTGSTPDPLKGSYSLQDYTNTGLAITAGTYDYYFNVGGINSGNQAPQNLVQGYEYYLPLFFGPIINPSSGASGTITFAVSGIPTSTTVDFPLADVVSWSQTGTTGTLVIRTNSSNVSAAMRLTTTGATPIQSTTLTFAVTSAVSGTINAPAHANVTWPLHVVNSSFSYGTPSSYPAIDATSLATFKSWMVTYGQKWQGTQSSMGCLDSFGQESVQFYDGAGVYRQVQTYDTNNGVTGNPSQWNTGITNCTNTYRSYVLGLTPVGATTGYYGFAHGLYQDYVANTTATSATAIDGLAKNVAGNALTAVFATTIRQREAAFITDSNYWDTKLFQTYGQGSDRTTFTTRGIDYLIGQLDQIGNSPNFIAFEPFMVGLQADTLIRYYNDGHTSDNRIPIVIKAVADKMYSTYFITPTGAVNTGCFVYSSFNKAIGNDPTDPNYTGGGDYRSLNMLLAPMYAWLFKITGNTTYQTEADTIFVQAMAINALAQGAGFHGKNYTQTYRWGFDYLTYRSPSNPITPNDSVMQGGTTVNGGTNVN